MFPYPIAWIITALTFGIADAIWLGTMVPRFYKPLIGEILSPKPRVAPGLAFYLIYITGIVFFAVAPALTRANLATAALNGAALGFVAFATFNLTNQTTLKVWSTKLTLVDMTWGTFATSLAASVAYAVVAAVV